MGGYKRPQKKAIDKGLAQLDNGEGVTHKEVNYILENFGESSAKKFVQNVDAKLALIRIRPKMFRLLIKGQHLYHKHT